MKHGRKYTPKSCDVAKLNKYYETVLSLQKSRGAVIAKYYGHGNDDIGRDVNRKSKRRK